MLVLKEMYSKGQNKLSQNNNIINLENNELMVKLILYITNKKLSILLTLSMLHVTIVMISHLVEKVPLQELLHATKFSMRLV